jgi:hypothetical protein
MTFRSRKLLDACRLLPCAACGAEDGTVVAAHGNSYADGKGRSLKSSDAAVAALCYRCHAEMDSGKSMSREERREMFLTAHIKTLRSLIERGILRVGS